MPTAQVFSFFRQPAPRDWSPQDIAEFYRVESVLIQAGLRVVSARGLSDEGDPWFVFCRAEDDEVIVHFARIDGCYVISAPAYCSNAVGRDFRSLVRGLIENHPMLQLRPRGDNLYLHPSALLVVLVATALFKLSPAAAAAPATQDSADTTAGRFLRSGGPAAMPAPSLAPLSEAEQGTLILAAINGALTLTVVAEPVTGVMSAAAHMPEVAGPFYATVVDTSPVETFHSAMTIGTGSVTPLPLQHESAAVVMQADLTNQPLTFAVLPAEAATVAGPVTAPPPLLPVVAVDPEVGSGGGGGVTYVSLSGLPDISSADKALLQTLGLTGDVTYLNGLPPVFSNAVKTGSHTVVHAAAAAEISHAAAETSPSPANNVTTPVPSVTPEPVATETPATHSAAPATAPAAAVPDMSAVIAAVMQFQAVEIHPVVLITAHAAIFYDAAAVTTQPGAVQSITYDFGDGFSISLVGLPAELAHGVVHV